MPERLAATGLLHHDGSAMDVSGCAGSTSTATGPSGGYPSRCEFGLTSCRLRAAALTPFPWAGSSHTVAQALPQTTRPCVGKYEYVTTVVCCSPSCDWSGEMQVLLDNSRLDQGQRPTSTRRPIWVIWWR